MENQGKPLVDIAEPIHELQCRPGKWPGKLVVFHNQSLADHSYRFDQKILGMHGVMQNVEKYCPIKTTGLKWKMYPIESADGNAGEGGGRDVGRGRGHGWSRSRVESRSRSRGRGRSSSRSRGRGSSCCRSRIRGRSRCRSRIGGGGWSCCRGHCRNADVDIDTGKMNIRPAFGQPGGNPSIATPHVKNPNVPGQKLCQRTYQHSTAAEMNVLIMKFTLHFHGEFILSRR